MNYSNKSYFFWKQAANILFQKKQRQSTGGEPGSFEKRQSKGDISGGKIGQHCR